MNKQEASELATKFFDGKWSRQAEKECAKELSDAFPYCKFMFRGTIYEIRFDENGAYFQPVGNLADIIELA